MNLAQAIETAQTTQIPGFLTDDASLSEERRKNEEAIALLHSSWMAAPKGEEGFDYSLVLALAKRNRELCDDFGIERLHDYPGQNLPRKLADADLVAGLAKLQHRSAKSVARSAGPDLVDMGIAYVEKKVSGMVLGIDIETTDRNPDRGYILNVGVVPALLEAEPGQDRGWSAYFGLPELYREKGVPLAEIHRISWADIEGKAPFTEDAAAHKALLKAMCKAPVVMAHNAAFEDAWFMLSLPGYAEARKAGKILLADSRDICRRIDPDIKSLPHDSSPAALENWARRRGVLKPDENERHLGLDDVFLMLDTVRAELRERKMLA